MFNKTKKLNKKIIICTLVLITLFANIAPISKAVRLSGEINIYSIGSSENQLLYKGGWFLTIFDVYKNEGKEYPAYNALFPTYGYNNPYDEELIDENCFLWKVVANGYPYKTIEELGCTTYEEAYTATQVAIYCAHCGHTPSDYSYFEGNASSKRIYDAFLRILENAENNKVKSDKNCVLKLKKEQNDWQINNQNLYRTYSVETNYNIDTYKVEILNYDNAIIVDENNIEKTEFNKQEKFKIILPMSKLNNSGEFEIKITTDAKKMPIYLGTSPYNAYVMTAPEYEKETVSFSQTYQENLTSVNITIQELDTKIGIENSIVNLLNSNKEKISTLTTNEQGKIFIEHLLPGTYYIEQIATEEGYNIYKKQIELKMDFNKIINLTINNAEENIQNIYNKEENIIITEEITNKNITNEVTNTNINNKVDSTTENNINNSRTENDETIKTDIKNENNQTNINNKTDIKNENNTNNSYNKNDETTKTDIKNENNQTNINNKTDIKNENNTNNSYNKNNINNSNTQNNSTIGNSHTYNSNNISKISNNEIVRKLPKTGM